jgi:serine protease
MAERVTPPYTGRLVVRLAPPVVKQLAARARRADLADITTLHALQRALRSYPGDLPSYPVVTVARTAEILAREAQAEKAGFVLFRSLTAYFIIDPRRRLHPDLTARMLHDLNSISELEVDLAYPEPGFSAPSAWAVKPDPLVTEQGYLDPAPRGIGVNTAGVWGSYDGSGIGFVDLESGWNLNHVELPPALLAPQPILNINDNLLAEHGTGVLGIVLAQANGQGITGISPAAKFLGVSSWLASLNPEGEETPDIPNAIYKVLPPVMNKGDVLLIEVQLAKGYPVEADEAVLIAIQTAVGQGIVVVEAAGNGTPSTGRDLDQPLPKQGKGLAKPTHSLNRQAGQAGSFIDSYAIMVSACRSSLTTGGHRRIGRAGFGSRIDCYAWGDSVKTLGTQGYVPDFDLTSAASAIIAGAAILLQEMVVWNGMSPLTSIQMQALLKSQGTDVLTPNGSHKIGVMPDLEAIAASFPSA